MKLIKTILPILLTLNTCILVVAQNGKDYLITTSGDTLSGKLKSITNFSKSISFLNSGQSEYKTYNASDLSFAIHKGTDTYQSVILQSVSEERIFLKVLALGKINLYKGENRYFLQKDSVVQVLMKKDTVINNVHKTDKTYIGYLTVFMKDSDIPMARINSTAFNDDDLARLVTSYNQSMGEQVPSANFEKKKVSTFSLGVKGGLYVSTLKYTEGSYADYDFESHQGSLIGIYANIRITDKFFLQPELYFVSKGGTYSQVLDTYILRTLDLNYSMQSSQISLNLRYNVLTGRFTPYFLAGFCYAISTDSRIYRQVIYNDYTVAYPEIGVTSEIGYRGAIGINYEVFKGWQISLEGLLENTKVHVSSSDDPDFYSNGVAILGNISYSFGK